MFYDIVITRTENETTQLCGIDKPPRNSPQSSNEMWLQPTIKPNEITHKWKWNERISFVEWLNAIDELVMKHEMGNERINI